MLNTGSEADYLHKALHASGIGTWHFNIKSGAMHMDGVAQSLFGTGSDNLSYGTVFSNANGNALNTVILALQTALSTGKIDLQYPTNSFTIIHVKGKQDIDSDFFIGTVQEVTNTSKNYTTAIDGDTLNTIIHEAPVAIGLYVGRELTVGVANDIMLSFWGKNRSAIGQTLEKAVPELEGQEFIKILTDIFDTGETYEVTDAAARLAVNGILGTYYFDFTYKPLFNSSGEVYAIMNTAVNVTDRAIAKKQLQKSESRFKAITNQSPMAIGLLKGREMIIEIGNAKIFEVWGKTRGIIGLPIMEALPELEGQMFLDLLQGVYDTGIEYRGYDILAKLNHNGVLTDVYFDFTYSALKDENGNTTGVLVLATDVTERLNTIRKIEESEARFKTVIYSAQAAMAVFKGRDLVADIANNSFLEFIGRDSESFIGKPLLESMPELIGQSSIEYMNNVFDNGIKTHHYGRQVNIMKNGVLTPNYYNVSYTPLFNAQGEVYAVLDIAIDVTESIKTQKAIEEAEASLRSAIELAELGTWSLVPQTGEVIYSDRMLEWFGLSGAPEDINDVLQSIHEDDRDRVQASILKSLQSQPDGWYDEEYKVVNRITGKERILHAQGKSFFDPDGLAYMISGTAQDITAIKKVQLALENEVKDRTDALLQANKELEEANVRLISTNEELEQYAYVASHDLQEPLRKISMFSNLLKERDKIGAHTGTIDKIVKSSERMSMLIKDLLEFSRLLNPDTRFVKTNLQNIVIDIKNDFELLIEEKDAKVDIEWLPIIDAVPLQMNQLFYNLIGNALKFIPANVNPHVTIGCNKLNASEVAQYISHPENVSYYQFYVTDNGIGIDEQYQKQIFEVFKRLHSRTEYSGSGIGLAICRRIAVNHNGTIYTKSEVGKGTTFYVILPEKQIVN